MNKFPRRRDVRKMLDSLAQRLNEHHHGDDYDHDFLNDVRDVMREGVDFYTAMDLALAEDDVNDDFGPDYAEDPNG